MIIRTKFVVASAMFFGLAAIGLAASSFAYVDGFGVEYTMTKNKDGVVLKSKKTTIHLGKNCDASSLQYGKGHWGWANGGVLVTFGKKTIGFPRQDTPFDDSRCPL